MLSDPCPGLSAPLPHTPGAHTGNSREQSLEGGPQSPGCSCDVSAVVHSLTGASGRSAPICGTQVTDRWSREPGRGFLQKVGSHAKPVHWTSVSSQSSWPGWGQECGAGTGTLILSLLTGVSLTWASSCRVQRENSPCQPQLAASTGADVFGGRTDSISPPSWPVPGAGRM